MAQYRAVIEGTIYAKPTQLFGQSAAGLVKVLLPELQRQSGHSPEAELVVYEVREVEVGRYKPTPKPTPESDPAKSE